MLLGEVIVFVVSWLLRKDLLDFRSDERRWGMVIDIGGVGGNPPLESWVIVGNSICALLCMGPSNSLRDGNRVWSWSVVASIWRNFLSSVNVMVIWFLFS